MRRDVLSVNQAITVVCFFFLLGANNSRDRAGRARRADRQTVFP